MPTSFLSGKSRLPLSLLILFDLVIAVLSALVAEFVRFGHFNDRLPFDLITIQALLAVILSLICGVYTPWRGRPLVERLGAVLLAWSLSFVGIMGYLFLTKTTADHSRLWLGLWIGVALFTAVNGRFSLYRLLMSLRRQGRNTRSVLVIGNGSNFHQVCRDFDAGNAFGYRLDAIIKHTDNEQTCSRLESILTEGKSYDECWLCLPLEQSDLVQPVMYAIRHRTMDIRYMPGMRDMPLLNHNVTMIGGFYSLDISCSPMDGANRIVKRMEDLLIGSMILFLILPVFLMVALAVKFSSPGPVLFKQFRHGADGKRIKVYKFRSMTVHQEESGTVTQATKGDTRVTRVGAFLRRTSLDELPQFINVLQGRMSIVGPRPHALAHNEYYKDLVESYMKRHKVKPGITGLAQVRGYRGETDTLDKMQKRVECDLEYINNWSMWLDLRIIIWTVFKGFVNPNAY